MCSGFHIERMQPEEYRNGGESLSVNYSFADTPFGRVIVASTPKGICHMSFIENEVEAIAALKKYLPNAAYHLINDQRHENAYRMINKNNSSSEKIDLHLKGTDFQMQVWEALLRIPRGKLLTYGDIAKQLGSSGASRAVGTAIGYNPIAMLIPCHRVVRTSGALGGYRWGLKRKAAIINWENADCGLW